MADQTALTTELLDYVRGVSLREDDILRSLREETRKYPMGYTMQVMPEEGQLLGFLVALTGARSVLEVGTFTGYSTLCMARSLPVDGRLVTCDLSGKWPEIGRPFWEKAGVADRIEIRVGDAADTLTTLLAEMGEGTFDLAFIDADKENYRRYYDRALALLRAGGLIVVDNTLFFGRVVDVDQRDAATSSIRELNALLREDDRVDLSMLTMADGITLLRKR